LLAGLDAEDAREMMRVVPGEFSGIVNDFGNKETPSRHRLSFLLMIALLRGTLLEKHPNQAIVEAGGVGYDLTIPVSTFTGLPAVGAEVRLKVHTHVREDLLALFGFLTQDEKMLFEKLIGVSGIGPKLAVTVLSGLAAGELVQAIRNGAIDQLVRIPGVGKKTAERMVLELRDKLMSVATATSATAGAAFNTIEEDVLSALLNLGCARPAAEAAIRKAKVAGTPQEFEKLFRRSLELVR
jgi:Holliday junction DNA helicase RuvA